MTQLALPATGFLPVILVVNLNDSESVMVLLGLSSWYCHKPSDVFE